MSAGNDLKRLNRLSAILLQLQTRRAVKASELANKFQVSIRTIYRDINALEQIGVPVYSIQDKGYSLAEGYKISPVMFSEEEANALLTAGQIMSGNDPSLSVTFYQALDKIRAVLNPETRDKLAFLSERIAVSPFIVQQENQWLATIQKALTNFCVLEISYQSSDQTLTERVIEPFAFYYSEQGQWILIAYCRLRADYRMFRLDRIESLRYTETHFEPHQLMLKDYLAAKEKNFGKA
ncbi:YafY family protein [Pedobacter aquatilis]|uniref:helix-turn-helix transcriptional regulator n=1 Tax=Pedobacter aquatilis TaxID=351343 RepID=UPI00292FFD4D|nr:YafY family protein [Pedobacter aquatilis]